MDGPFLKLLSFGSGRNLTSMGGRYYGRYWVPRILPASVSDFPLVDPTGRHALGMGEQPYFIGCPMHAILAQGRMMHSGQGPVAAQDVSTTRAQGIYRCKLANARLQTFLRFWMALHLDRLLKGHLHY